MLTWVSTEETMLLGSNHIKYGDTFDETKLDPELLKSFIARKCVTGDDITVIEIPAKEDSETTKLLEDANLQIELLTREIDDLKESHAKEIELLKSEHEKDLSQSAKAAKPDKKADPISAILDSNG